MTDPAAGRLGAWRRTAAWYRVPGVSALALGVGLAAGRADVVLLAAPLVIGWVAALIAGRHLVGRPQPRAQTEVDAASFGRGAADVRTAVTGLDGVEFASVAQPGEDAGPIGAAVTIPGGAADRSITARFRASRWGMTTVARPDSLGAGPDGLLVAGPVRYGPVRSELILPAVTVIPPLTLPPILGGWAGAHVSRRPGQGSDLVDLREFAPGDRLKSIHWRAYARHQRLYTRRTLSDADAELMICLDLSAYLAPRRAQTAAGRYRQLLRLRAKLAELAAAVDKKRDPVGHARREEAEKRLLASSLDHAVAAATAVAAAHIGQGDRVGLMTATPGRRTVRPGTGARQLRRIRYELASLDDRRHRMLAVSWWRLVPGQIVVWCSPLTSEASIRAAVDCAARGHRVVVIDTLPLAGLFAHASTADADHLRILVVERQRSIERLKARGIGVIGWDGGEVARQVADAARVMRGRR